MVLSPPEMEQTYRILLYYLYRPIDDPDDFACRQRQLCEDLGLLGRIIVAEEGINGTVSGERAATDRYIEVMREDAGNEKLVFKGDDANGHAFKKLSVKVRSEIVTLNLGEEKDIDPGNLTGRRLDPANFYEAMNQEGALILDGRNKYESDLGHFEGAICPDVENFRDFPEWIRNNLADAKDRPVLTYCTGGIRCEKLSGFLMKEGFKNVHQLDGGIVTYGKDPDVKGRDFKGQCYVFDSRIGVSVNSTNPSVVATCRNCGVASERYVNCAWKPCNFRIFLCSSCEERDGRFCSEDCSKLSCSKSKEDAGF
ncbi:MAG: rhodanese-related sulfurtransferase [Verrucomicrobiota bacterium]|nr:rhodanese-related sulfurtransferase [Verrucomicrobiota bacterium]